MGKKSYPNRLDQNRLTNSGACMFYRGKKAIIVVTLISPQSKFGAPPAKLATATMIIEDLVAVAPDSAAAFSSADMTSCELRLTLTLAFTTCC